MNNGAPHEIVKTALPVNIDFVHVESPEFSRFLDIRNYALNEPHGESFQTEPHEADKAGLLLAAREPEARLIVGGLRVMGVGSKVLKLERVSVLPEYQRRNVGRTMIRAVVGLGQACGADIIRLMAREGTQGLYGSEGFEHTGEWGAKGPFMQMQLGRIGTLED